MVDFAKHSIGIHSSEYAEAEKKVKKYPHYLGDRDPDKVKHSDHILG